GLEKSAGTTATVGKSLFRGFSSLVVFIGHSFKFGRDSGCVSAAGDSLGFGVPRERRAKDSNTGLFDPFAELSLSVLIAACTAHGPGACILQIPKQRRFGLRSDNGCRLQNARLGMRRAIAGSEILPPSRANPCLAAPR